MEETTISRTCDRVRRCRRLWRLVHDREIVKWTTTSTTPSERLRRLRASLSSLHRQRLCGNVIPAFGLRGLVLRCYHLVEFSWLVRVHAWEIFCFPCYEPINGIRASSMCSWYAWLEHMGMWALMIMLLQFFYILDHSGIVGLKLPEINLTWPCSWDLSHTWHASTYVALRVHVSPTIIMIYFIKSC
jgi:hypothetical protein